MPALYITNFILWHWHTMKPMFCHCQPSLWQYIRYILNIYILCFSINVFFLIKSISLFRLAKCRLLCETIIKCILWHKKISKPFNIKRRCILFNIQLFQIALILGIILMCTISSQYNSSLSVIYGKEKYIPDNLLYHYDVWCDHSLFISDSIY